MAKLKTTWGTDLDTGAGAIDIVMQGFPIGQEVSKADIIAAVKVRGLKERNAIRQHMHTLKKNGHVAKTANGWARISE